MNEFNIVAIIFFIILIGVLIYLKKIDNKIKDIAVKIDFFDEKLDSENAKIMSVINQQYTDVMTAMKNLEAKAEEKEKSTEEDKSTDEELVKEAKEIAEEYGTCSASLLQRILRIGYARAARLLDMLEDEGLIEAADGVNPRRYIGEKRKWLNTNKIDCLVNK